MRFLGRHSPTAAHTVARDNDNWFEVANLRAGYGSASVLKGISLSMQAREVVAIIGPNGAGKSTLLKAISGVVPVSSGEIWFRGERIDGRPTHDIVRKGIVQVPEGRHLFADMTVVENLLLGAHLRRDGGEVREEIANLGQRLPSLRSRGRHKAGTGSGGEQQILAIARALMAKPRLLLLDEPSIGLAPKIVKEVADIIRSVSHGYDVGIILVEQNARMALSVSQRAYVIDLGRIQLSGNSRALLEDSRVQKAYLSE